MLVRRRACRLSLETSRSNSVSCMSLGIRYTVRASSTSETPPTTNRGQSTATLLSTLATRRSTMVKPSDCRRCKLVADRSMALMLACESESMMRTFLRNTAESVSASESTSVDLPTPPLVFMTAMVLRMPRHHPSRVLLIERTASHLGLAHRPRTLAPHLGPTPWPRTSGLDLDHGWCDGQMWQTADA